MTADEYEFDVDGRLMTCLVAVKVARGRWTL